MYLWIYLKDVVFYLYYLFFDGNEIGKEILFLSKKNV